MINLIYLIILALAVSLDSFGVGVTYGFRKIKIPVTSILIISFASAIMIMLSMQIGVWISYILTPLAAKWIGSLILIFVGFWAVLQVLNHQDDDEDLIKETITKKTTNKILSIELKKLGLVIQILKKPLKADIDRSGYISPVEASILGLALSLDAFGAGLGAALLGFNPLITAATIAGMSGLFILLGMRLGFWFSELGWLQKYSVLPGLILILVGLIKIF